MQPPLPYVSVVIPAFNRAESLRRCLASLISQVYPSDRFEIIVVDDGSTDDIATAVHEVTDGWNGRVSCLRKANGGPASARNAGIKAAIGDIVAFIDSDCSAEPDWLSQMVEVLERRCCQWRWRYDYQCYVSWLDCPVCDVCEVLPSSGAATVKWIT